jgi:TatD DNase family protein
VIAQTYIDTHTHLDDEQYSGDLDATLANARSLGVSAMINIGYSPARWSSTLALAKRYSFIRYVLGLHPGHADEWSEQLLASLTALVDQSSPVAIGEIGLDYYWTTENKAIQRSSFEHQLELADRKSLPVVIHQRGAADDVRTILSAAPDTLRVVLHSCDGDPALMDLAQERGWMIGVGGLMTRRQSKALRSRLPSFPLDKIVLETDSPYLVPSGVKLRRNTPAMIPLIAERLAGLLNQPVSEVAAQTTQNADRMFGLAVAAGAS